MVGGRYGIQSASAGPPGRWPACPAPVRGRHVRRQNRCDRARKALVPLSFDGPDRFILPADPRGSGGDLLVQERHKNGLPRTVRLSGETAVEIDPLPVQPRGGAAPAPGRILEPDGTPAASGSACPESEQATSWLPLPSATWPMRNPSALRPDRDSVPPAGKKCRSPEPRKGCIR